MGLSLSVLIRPRLTRLVGWLIGVLALRGEAVPLTGALRHKRNHESNGSFGPFAGSCSVLLGVAFNQRTGKSVHFTLETANSLFMCPS